VKAAIACLLVLACGCSPPRETVTGLDPDRGRLLLKEFGCASCHVIPGVAASMSPAAPSLEGLGRRVYVAGILPNTLENVSLWIQAPQDVDPLTAMPDLGVSPDQARQMAAYLMELR
jgi:cytochrome c